MTPITFFDSPAAPSKRESTLTLDGLRALILATSAPAKPGLPWLKLARFGEARSRKGSLRHNANVLAITGIEGDYDGETMAPSAAVATLDAAGVSALVYTSPSHRPERPRWRVLCPTSAPLPPDQRAALVARLNGVLGGVLSRESFALSQAYYFGAVTDGAPVQAWIVGGTPIDTLRELDAGAAWPASAPLAPLPALPAGLPPDAHCQAALDRARDLLTAPEAVGQRHQALLTATRLVAPMVRAGYLDAGAAVLALSDAMEASGRVPNDGEVESALSGAVHLAVPYEPPTQGEEFDLIEIPRPAARPSLALIHPADCDLGTGREYLVKGLLSRGDVAAIVGAPGCGKSVLAPFIAYMVAQGRAVFGRRTRPGRVLYLAAEDGAGMRQRIHALRQRHGDAPDFALAETGNLRDPAAVTLLSNTVAQWKPALVVVDTLGAAFAGMDENAAADMGQVVALARRIAATGAAVLLIHHIAKHGDGTPRGHSVLDGTLDLSLRLESAEGGIVRGLMGKNRNGALTGLRFRLDVARLGQDSDGDGITAPVATELPAAAPRPADALPKAARAALAVLADMADSAGQGADESAWRTRCIDERVVSGAEGADSQARAWRRAYADLIQARAVRASGGRVWVVDQTADGGEFDRAPANALGELVA